MNKSTSEYDYFHVKIVVVCMGRFRNLISIYLLVLLGKKAHCPDETLNLHAPGSTGGW